MNTGMTPNGLMMVKKAVKQTKKKDNVVFSIAIDFDGAKVYLILQFQKVNKRKSRFRFTRKRLLLISK